MYVSCVGGTLSPLDEANGRFFRRQIATYRDEVPPFVYEEGESDETVWLGTYTMHLYVAINTVTRF